MQEAHVHGNSYSPLVLINGFIESIFEFVGVSTDIRLGCGSEEVSPPESSRDMAAMAARWRLIR